jgi:hypothetical protein
VRVVAIAARATEVHDLGGTFKHAVRVHVAEPVDVAALAHPDQIPIARERDLPQALLPERDRARTQAGRHEMLVERQRQPAAGVGARRAVGAARSSAGARLPGSACRVGRSIAAGSTAP